MRIKISVVCFFALLLTLFLFSSCNDQSLTKPPTTPSESHSETLPQECAHEAVIDPEEAAGCITVGKTEGAHCGKCDEMLTAQKELPALGHNYENEYCSRCGAPEPMGRFSFRLNGDGKSYTVTNAKVDTSLGTRIVFPSDHEGKPVTAIGKSACKSIGIMNVDSSLAASIVIPDSIIAIEEEAFKGNKKIESITFGKNVKLIGMWAFAGCEKLTSITLPQGLTDISSFAFANCTTLQEIRIPGSVKSIGNYTFVDCVALEKVILEEGVLSVGNFAFTRCTGIKSITFPKSVISMGENVFKGCSALEKIFCQNTDPQEAEWSEKWLEGCEATVKWGEE